MRKTLLTFSTVAVISFGGLFVGSSEAVNAQSLDQVKKEQKEVKVKLSKAEKKIADVLYEIKDLGKEINKIEAEINKADSKIKANEKQVKELQEEIDSLNKEIERREEVLKKRLSAYQENGGHLKLTDALFGTESLVDVYGKIETAVTITNSDQELMLATANDKAAVEQKQMDIEVLNEELEKENKKNKERKAEKKAQNKLLQSKKAKVEKEVSKLKNESNELAALRADIERSLAAPAAPVVASATVSNNGESTTTLANNLSNNNNTTTLANNLSNNNNTTSSNSNAVATNATTTSTAKQASATTTSTAKQASATTTSTAEQASATTTSTAEQASATTTSTAKQASATTTSTAKQASATTTSTAKQASKPASVPYTGGGGTAIAAGKKFIGNSTYSLGAQNPSTGTFDCSGFVQWAYKQEGVNLPRTAGAMASVGKKVPYSEAKPGDLVLFRNGGHVGIYLGGGKFLGSQSSTAVAIADMNSGYWKQHFDGNVRRVK